MYQIIFDIRQLNKVVQMKEFQKWFHCAYSLTERPLKEIASEYYLNLSETRERGNVDGESIIKSNFSLLERYLLEIPYPKLPKNKETLELTQVNESCHFEVIFNNTWALLNMYAGVNNIEKLQNYIKSIWFELAYALPEKHNYPLIEGLLDISTLVFWHGSQFDDDNYLYLFTKENKLVNEIINLFEENKIKYRLNENQLKYFQE